MSIFEDTNPRALKELLGEIHNRSTVLPDFQRDFVWDPAATQELVVSIANNYPAGSILRVRDSQRLFAAREFEGAPLLGGMRHTFLVLDGQQRLTSLYQAFYGKGDHRYFLDLRKLIEGAEFEDAIFHLRSTTRQAQALADFEVQSRDLMLPLSVLEGGAGTFSQWVRRVAKRLPDPQRDAFEDGVDPIEARWIRVIDDYQFPVVTLSDKTSADALCTIFETLNRTGVKLSVYELLTARFWPMGINLRELWDEAKASHPIIETFQVDPYYLLMAVALVSRRTPSCTKGDVLALTGADITTWWGPIVRGFADGLAMLRDDCRVVLPKWLPYPTMLVPLAAVLAKIGPNKGPEAGAHRERLKRWFWCAVFGQAYESSTNSQTAKDYGELVAWLNGGLAPASVTELRFDPMALHDVTPRQRAIYRGTMCLILGAGGGARDFHTQAVITGALMEQHGIDDHHIFPAAYLAKAGVTQSRVRDSVLNRTLIDRTSNQVISARAPSVYLGEMRKATDFPLDTVLSSHLLPTGSESPLLTDDFEAFFDWRRNRLWQEIQRATGLTQATDLEAVQEQEPS